MSKPIDTKYISAYNTTYTHDPIHTTTNEQDTMLLFSISTMNSTYEDTVGTHTENIKEIT